MNCPIGINEPMPFYDDDQVLDMGDMADDFLDKLCDGDLDGFTGVAWEEETGSFVPHGHPRRVCCHHCKRGPFLWEEFGEGFWRLVEPGGVVHSCLPVGGGKRMGKKR
jgi:hypothetical protein